MRVLRVAAAAIIVAGCGGGNGGGTPPPPAVASVLIAPTGAQSINVGGTVAFTAQARDAQDRTLSNRTITWTSTDVSKVSLSATQGAGVTATGVAAGSSQIYATSETRESARITVTVNPAGPPPQQATVDATTSNTFSPSSVTIAAGGTVTWNFAATHNVIFGTNKPTGGDIPDQSSGTASRTFPNTGSYPYTCTLHAGMNGTVTVVQP